MLMRLSVIQMEHCKWLEGGFLGLLGGDVSISIGGGV